MSITTEYANRVECERELADIKNTSINFMNMKLEVSGECILVHQQATLYRHFPAPGQ